MMSPAGAAVTTSYHRPDRSGSLGQPIKNIRDVGFPCTHTQSREKALPKALVEVTIRLARSYRSDISWKNRLAAFGFEAVYAATCTLAAFFHDAS
jgi:hypothetical protein